MDYVIKCLAKNRCVGFYKFLLAFISLDSLFYESAIQVVSCINANILTHENMEDFKSDKSFFSG